MIKPSEINKLSEYFIAFRLDRWFITDNRTVFLPPEGGFCNQCFLRRYFSEYDGQKTDAIAEAALDTAKALDASHKENPSWSAFPVGDENTVKRFKLIPYENCSLCGKIRTCNRDTAHNSYQQLLDSSSVAKMSELRDLLFSFGFSKNLHTSNALDISGGASEKLLGGNYYSQLSSRILTSAGQITDLTTLGYSSDRDLAETKAVMEFIERYAFIEHAAPRQTKDFDDTIIKDFLSLYSRDISEQDLGLIKHDALWATNLETQKTHPVPLRFIYDKADLDYVHPCSSGFAAHVDFRKSLAGSIFELIERDAFIRFWHKPGSAQNYSPDQDIKDHVNNIISVLEIGLKNENLEARYFVIQSPSKIPVVMTTISSTDLNKAPALLFGFGTGINCRQAFLKSLDELRTNAINLIAIISTDDSFLVRRFDHPITTIPDRMNYYSTCQPRPKLVFLDSDNPLMDGAIEDLEDASLDTLVNRCTTHGIEIFGIDTTPECFADKHVFVTRAFSPNLYPLQYKNERAFNLPTDESSCSEELPHFFI